MTIGELSEHKDSLRLLLVTATPIETFHVRQALQPLAAFKDVVKVPHGTQTYFVGRFGIFPAVHVQCSDMGAIKRGGSMTTVAAAINVWKPKAVVMIGIAMGIETKHVIGDILVSESVVDYESERLGNQRVARGNKVPAGAILLNRFKNVTGWELLYKGKRTPKIFPGPILSGAKLIDNLRERTKLLKRYPDAIGGEMEGAGVCAACTDGHMVEWILVKGVCDFGDGNKNVEKDERQNLAASTATALALNVFSTRNGFDALGLQWVEDDEAAITHAPNIDAPEVDTIVNEIYDGFQLPQNDDKMASDIQQTIATYLSLTTIDKYHIIKSVGIELDELINLSPHEMDKRFFLTVRSGRLMHKLWDAINALKPFANKTNPFVS